MSEMGVKLSVIVLTKNEEKNIAACLESVQWADELIVLDSFSEDATVEIARSFGARVHQRQFVNYPDQRNAAIELARGDWVFFIDADERATPGLAAEVRRVIENESPVGWWVPRKNYIFGRWIRHAGWYPDYQLRLFRRHRARYDEAREVHELVILDGEAGYLENALIHYNYDNLAQFFARQDLYTNYEARAMFKQGIRVKPQNFILQPLREFRRRYLSLEGYRDGFHGLLLSSLMAYYELVKYLKLRRMWLEKRR